MQEDALLEDAMLEDERPMQLMQTARPLVSTQLSSTSVLACLEVQCKASYIQSLALETTKRDTHPSCQ